MVERAVPSAFDYVVIEKLCYCSALVIYYQATCTSLVCKIYVQMFEKIHQGRRRRSLDDYYGSQYQINKLTQAAR